VTARLACPPVSNIVKVYSNPRFVKKIQEIRCNDDNTELSPDENRELAQNSN